jgi:hypothetical protein
MNRIPVLAGSIALFALLGFSGCVSKNEPPTAPPSTPAAEAVPETPAPDGILSTHYMDAATALAADDFDKAKVSLTALAKETTGDLQAKAQAAADTGQIAAMREAFKALSSIAVRMQLPPDYAVAYCPMYKGGAKWVQKKDTLANPYYGKSSDMATCGRFET